jgi:hypothetical protein
MIAVDHRDRIRRGVYSGRDIEASHRRLLRHLHEWSHGQFDMPNIELNYHEDPDPEHVTVADYRYEEPSEYSVHFRDLGGHLADVIDQEVNGHDWGWNTDGNETFSAHGVPGPDNDSLLSSVGQLPIEDDSALGRLYAGHHLTPDDLYRAKREATLLRSRYEARVDRVENRGGEADPDDIDRRDAADRVAGHINTIRKRQSERNDEQGAEFNHLLQQLRGARHVIADPTDTDE